jgi:hypothetical protein
MLIVSDLESNLTTTIPWDIAKLSELGVNTKRFMELGATPEMMRDLLKGILYLREKYPQEWNDVTRGKARSSATENENIGDSRA